MAVLLRQPQGFESLRVIPEELHAEDPALANREDARELHVHLRAVACATPDVPHDNSVGGVDEVAYRFHCVGVPGVAELLEKTYYRLATYKGPRLGPTLGHPPHDVGVEQLTNGAHVSRV